MVFVNKVFADEVNGSIRRRVSGFVCTPEENAIREKVRKSLSCLKTQYWWQQSIIQARDDVGGKWVVFIHCNTLFVLKCLNGNYRCRRWGSPNFRAITCSSIVNLASCWAIYKALTFAWYGMICAQQWSWYCVLALTDQHPLFYISTFYQHAYDG